MNDWVVDRALSHRSGAQLAAARPASGAVQLGSRRRGRHAVPTLLALPVHCAGMATLNSMQLGGPTGEPGNANGGAGALQGAPGAVHWPAIAAAHAWGCPSHPLLLRRGGCACLGTPAGPGQAAGGATYVGGGKCGVCHAGLQLVPHLLQVCERGRTQQTKLSVPVGASRSGPWLQAGCPIAAARDGKQAGTLQSACA